MACDRERQLLGSHSASVVADSDQLASASGDRDLNTSGAGINAVLEQFFHDRCGSFNHFAGGDLIDQVRWQLTYRRNFFGGGGHGRRM